MLLFYAPDITTPLYTLDEVESGHCVRVLRLREGDTLNITDGRGTLYDAEVVDPHPKRCSVRIVAEHHNWEQRPYTLTIAVAPTKNIDRIEWFVEKATECGIDRIIPTLCDHSERKVVKGERLDKIAISAMKQSLKAYLPQIDPLTPLREVLAMPFEGTIAGPCLTFEEATGVAACCGVLLTVLYRQGHKVAIIFCILCCYHSCEQHCVTLLNDYRTVSLFGILASRNGNLALLIEADNLLYFVVQHLCFLYCFIQLVCIQKRSFFSARKALKKAPA